MQLRFMCYFLNQHITVSFGWQIIQDYNLTALLLLEMTPYFLCKLGEVIATGSHSQTQHIELLSWL